MDNPNPVLFMLFVGLLMWLGLQVPHRHWKAILGALLFFGMVTGVFFMDL